MRNIKSNHRGLAGWNLYLSNMMAMNRYYFRNRGKIEYPVRWWKRIDETIKAAIVGWTPHQMKTEKRYLKKFQ